MQNSFPYVDILIFGVIAIFLIFRLKSLAFIFVKIIVSFSVSSTPLAEIAAFPANEVTELPTQEHKAKNRKAPRKRGFRFR